MRLFLTLSGITLAAALSAPFVFAQDVAPAAPDSSVRAINESIVEATCKSRFGEYQVQCLSRLAKWEA